MIWNPWKRIRELESELHVAKRQMCWINQDHANETRRLRSEIFQMDSENRNREFERYRASLEFDTQGETK